MFVRLDIEMALSVAKEDRFVDEEYAIARGSLVTYMVEDPPAIQQIIPVLWALRALERVGDHACNIAEQVIYLAKGKDVRHIGITDLIAQVRDHGR